MIFQIDLGEKNHIRENLVRMQQEEFWKNMVSIIQRKQVQVLLLIN